MPRLTSEQRNAIQYQLDRCYEADQDHNIVGEHAVLIGILNKYGYRATDLMNAYEIAEKLLWQQ